MSEENHTSSIPPGIAGAMTYFFPFIGGLVMLGMEKEDRTVRFHAAQSIIFWMAAIPWAFLTMLPMIGWLFAVTFLVAWLFLMYEAWIGKEFEIPYLGAIARRQVFGEEEPVSPQPPPAEPPVSEDKTEE